MTTITTSEHGREAAQLPGPGFLAGAATLKHLNTDPNGFLNDMLRFGPIARFNLFFTQNAVFLADPVGVRSALSKAGTIGLARRPMHELGQVFGHEGIFTTTDLAWQRYRSMLAPLFKAQALQAKQERIRNALHTMLKEIRIGIDICDSVDITRSVSRAIMGITGDILIGTYISPERSMLMRELLEKMLFRLYARINNPLQWMASLLPEKLSPRQVKEDRSDTSALRALVSELYAEFRCCARDADPPSIFSVLSANEKKGTLPPGATVDNVLQFLTAGHATMVTFLSWLLYRFAERQSLYDWLELEYSGRNGAPVPGDVRQLRRAYPQTFALMQEVLRLNPPIPTVFREAHEETIIDTSNEGKLRIPKGWLIYIPIVALHHNSELWPQPEVFQPERFLEESEDNTQHTLGFCPFGAGPRTCLGLQMAYLIGAHLVATLMAERPRFIPSAIPRTRVHLIARPENMYLELGRN